MSEESIQHNILEQNLKLINDRVVFSHEEQYTASTLWTAGTYFLKYAPDMVVARMFPMLGFISPEWNSGKSTAVKVINALSHNNTKRGSRTPAVILNRIDRMANAPKTKKGQQPIEFSPDKITLALDELDKVFRYGNDNADLISLFNLGYEYDAVIARCDRFSGDELETSAYCAKVFGALSVAKIPPDTKSRCLIIPMRPGDPISDNDNLKAWKQQQANNLEWSRQPGIIESLHAMEQEDVPLKFAEDIEFLSKRDKQIWKLMLSIAYLVGDGWFEKGIAAARFFIDNIQSENTLYRTILISTYRIIAASEKKATHSNVMHRTLQEQYGIPKWFTVDDLAKCYSDYDPLIKPKGIRLDGYNSDGQWTKDINRNGYEHRLFDGAFKMYGIAEEVAKTDNVDVVDTVDGRRQYISEVKNINIEISNEKDSAETTDIYPLLGSTRSTSSTSQIDGGVSSSSLNSSPSTIEETEMDKKQIKKLYRSYIFGEKVDGIVDWPKLFPLFNKNLTEIEKEVIHDEYCKRGKKQVDQLVTG